MPRQRSQEPFSGPNSARTSLRHPSLRNAPQRRTGLTTYEREAWELVEHAWSTTRDTADDWPKPPPYTWRRFRQDLIGAAVLALGGGISVAFLVGIAAGVLWLYRTVEGLL